MNDSFDPTVPPLAASATGQDLAAAPPIQSQVARPGETDEAANAYFGTWDADERAHTVTHHVRASLRSAEVGSDFVRPYELSGEQLGLRYPVSAPDGERRTRVLIWRRTERF